MTTPLLVTGGTGTLGRLVVRRLRDAGRDVRVLSRSSQDPREGIDFVTGDVSTGEGLDTAVKGVDTIVHCAGSTKGDDEKARHLTRAAAQAGVQHLVHISVVGVDSVPVVSGIDRAMFGYFAAKREAERIVADSDVRWTTLRATQLHDWVLTVLRQSAKMPVLPLWAGVRFQPVEADDVAARLVDLALGQPAGLVPDIGGPRVYGMDELARSYLAASGKRRLIMNMRTPGKAAAAFRAGANLAPERAVGQGTWEEFLTRQFG